MVTFPSDIKPRLPDTGLPAPISSPPLLQLVVPLKAPTSPLILPSVVLLHIRLNHPLLIGQNSLLGSRFAGYGTPLEMLLRTQFEHPAPAFSLGFSKKIYYYVAAYDPC